jgi:hypothetical protein
MKELIDALSFTERTDTTLMNLIVDAMQDAQYSPHPGLREKIAVLNKYQAEYGHLTVGEIRALVTPGAQR